jgi:hypothetical protein
MKLYQAFIFGAMCLGFGWYGRAMKENRQDEFNLRDAPMGYHIADNDSSKMIAYDFSNEKVIMTIGNTDYDAIEDYTPPVTYYYDSTTGERYVRDAVKEKREMLSKRPKKYFTDSLHPNLKYYYDEAGRRHVSVDVQ